MNILRIDLSLHTGPFTLCTPPECLVQYFLVGDVASHYQETWLEWTESGNLWCRKNRNFTYKCHTVDCATNMLYHRINNFNKAGSLTVRKGRFKTTNDTYTGYSPLLYNSIEAQTLYLSRNYSIYWTEQSALQINERKLKQSMLETKDNRILQYCFHRLP